MSCKVIVKLYTSKSLSVSQAQTHNMTYNPLCLESRKLEFDLFLFQVTKFLLMKLITGTTAILKDVNSNHFVSCHTVFNLHTNNFCFLCVL